jgi:hypothetical protein
VKLDLWRMAGFLAMTVSAAIVVGALLIAVWSLAPGVGAGWAQ